MRAAVIEAAATFFAPDLLIVDKVQLGVAGGLLPALRRLRAEFDITIILGLRETMAAGDPTLDLANLIEHLHAFRTTSVVT